MSKGAAVCVAESPIAHARASTSRFAKAGMNMRNSFRARFDRPPIVKQRIAP